MFYAAIDPQTHHCVKRYQKVSFGNVLRSDWLPDLSLRKVGLIQSRVLVTRAAYGSRMRL